MTICLDSFPPLVIRRTYQSNSGFPGILGPGWQCWPFDAAVKESQLKNTRILTVCGQGVSEDQYALFDKEKGLFAPLGPDWVETVSLRKTADGYVLIDLLRGRQVFDGAGHVLCISDTRGNGFDIARGKGRAADLRDSLSADLYYHSATSEFPPCGDTVCPDDARGEFVRQFRKEQFYKHVQKLSPTTPRSKDTVRRDDTGTEFLWPTEEMKGFLKALDEYGTAKNATGDRAEELFGLEEEKAGYERRTEAENESRERNSQELARKQAESARLREQIKDTNDRIAQTADRIERLKASVQELRRRLAQVKGTTAEDKEKSERLRSRIRRLERLAAEEEASMRSLQFDRSSSSNALDTVMGAMSAVGGVASITEAASPRRYSGRSAVRRDTYSYVPSYSGSGSGSVSGRGHKASPYFYDLGKQKYYDASKGGGAAYGGSGNWKKSVYRQRLH